MGMARSPEGPGLAPATPENPMTATKARAIAAEAIFVLFMTVSLWLCVREALTFPVQLFRWS